jgi:hypothetical protein
MSPRTEKGHPFRHIPYFLSSSFNVEWFGKMAERYDERTG